jgi:group I intron endonuclease
MKRYIYGLVDPRTDEIRYIGQTLDLDRRFKEHVGGRVVKNTPKHNWIKQLMGLDLLPEIVVLEECDKDMLDEREAFWIRNIPNLKNLRPGGSSYEGHSKEIRERISKSGENHPNYGKSLSEEVRRKISKTLTGRPPHENTIKGLTKSAQAQGARFLIFPPEGEPFEIFNMSKFCRANNLSCGHMIAVSQGKRNHHKGYRCQKL